MGSLVSRMMNMLYTRKMDVVLVGLASAGKSTLLGVISEGAAVAETSPTIAMNVKIVKKGGVQMKCWDLGYVHYYCCDTFYIYIYIYIYLHPTYT